MLYKTATNEFRLRWIQYIYQLQEKICTALAREDGKEIFATDEWERDGGKGGGGQPGGKDREHSRHRGSFKGRGTGTSRLRCSDSASSSQAGPVAQGADDQLARHEQQKAQPFHGLNPTALM